MIILDTNVFSEILALKPDDRVTRWLDSQASASVWTTSVTIFEIRFGLETMPAGRRRTSLMVGFESWLSEVVQERRAI